MGNEFTNPSGLCSEFGSFVFWWTLSVNVEYYILILVAVWIFLMLFLSYILIIVSPFQKIRINIGWYLNCIMCIIYSWFWPLYEDISLCKNCYMDILGPIRNSFTFQYSCLKARISSKNFNTLIISIYVLWPSAYLFLFSVWNQLGYHPPTNVILDINRLKFSDRNSQNSRSTLKSKSLAP